MNPLTKVKKSLPYVVSMAIEMNLPRTPYGLKILEPMLSVLKPSLEDFQENIKNIVFTIQV